MNGSKKINVAQQANGCNMLGKSQQTAPICPPLGRHGVKKAGVEDWFTIQKSWEILKPFRQDYTGGKEFSRQ
jgi:hypothetical protein